MYQVGAVVDGFELTSSGEWVRLSPTGGSPYRLGDVVDGHLLDADLTWVPLRRTPAPPYAAGDVVDGYVLTPDGGWVPLAAQVRERAPAGAARRPASEEGPTGPGGRSAAERAERRSAEHRRTVEREAAERRAAAQEASAAQRAAEHRAAQERAAQARAAEARPTGSGAAPSGTAAAGTGGTSSTEAAPARRTYRVGDVVNGHVLTPQMRWVPVGGEPARPTSPQGPASRQPAGRPSGRQGVPGIVPILFLGFVLVQIMRACS